MRSSFHVLAALLVVAALTAVQCGRKEASPPQPSPPEAEAETPEIPIPEAVLVQDTPADEIAVPEQEEAETPTPDLRIPDAALLETPAEEIPEPEQEEAGPSAAGANTETLRVDVLDKRPYHINGRPVSGDTFEDWAEDLHRILAEKQARARRDGVTLIVIIAPDESAPWNHLAEVFSQSIRAGIEEVGFAPVKSAGDSGIE